MSDAAVLQLAEAAGIATEWTDVHGAQRRVAPESLRMILEALDLPCATAAQCKESGARLAAEEADGALPPLMTAEAGRATRLRPECRLHGRSYRVEFEDGGYIDGRFAADASLPPDIVPVDRPGYHRFMSDDASMTLAVAPPRCFGVGDERLWGLAAQLYALRRPGDGGIGDFTALATLVRTAARYGASATAISPVHAMFSADRARFSPYSPSSRLFLNALHIDPAAVLGEQALARAIADADAAGRLAALEQAELIDWPEAAGLRLDLLRRLYRMFREAGGDAAFEQFRLRGGRALADHACFEALHAEMIAAGQGGDWRAWPAACRDPRSAAVARFADEHADEVAFHAFLQWQAAQGLAAAQRAARDAGMPIGLIADLAVGADTGGSQAWSRQGDMLNGLSIGAPPDMLNARGQNWGLGAFSPRALKLNGFRAYIEMLRAVFAHAGGVRIDHVLGLARLWLVPERASALQGAYLRYPLRDLLRLIALESWRHRAIVIGEDLGTVPEGLGDQLARAGMLGIRVLWFQHDAAGFLPPAKWPAHAIATTATHDLPTVAGWWRGNDIGWRSRLDLLEDGVTETAARDARGEERRALWQALTAAGAASGAMPPATADCAPIEEAAAFLGATPAPLAMLPLEDALGLSEQPNLPGTTDAHPNWRRRLPATTDGLLEAPAVAARLAALHSARHAK